jgi:hypothetical protein
VALDGTTEPLTAPDPRVFSVHKAWLSTRFDRDPLKKPLHRGQPEIVARIVQEYFPHLLYTGEYMRFSPKKRPRVHLWQLIKGDAAR